MAFETENWPKVFNIRVPIRTLLDLRPGCLSNRRIGKKNSIDSCVEGVDVRYWEKESGYSVVYPIHVSGIRGRGDGHVAGHGLQQGDGRAVYFGCCHVGAGSTK